MRAVAGSLLLAVAALMLMGPLEQRLRETVAAREVGLEDLDGAPPPGPREIEVLVRAAHAALLQPRRRLDGLPEGVHRDLHPRIVRLAVSDGRSRARRARGAAHGIVRAVEEALGRLDLRGLALGGTGRPWLRFELVLGPGGGGAEWFTDGWALVPLAGGRRRVGLVFRDDLLRAAREAGRYLARARLPDGRFVYDYLPRSDTSRRRYNLARHAAALGALYELYGISGDRWLLDAARAPMAYLLGHVGPADGEATALTILALAQQAERTGDPAPLQTARGLARFLRERLLRAVVPPREAAPAILALARLNDLDPDPARLDAAEAGARRLLEPGVEAGDEGNPWVPRALAALDRARPRPAYRRAVLEAAGSILALQTRSPGRAGELGGFFTPGASGPTALRTMALLDAYRIARGHGDPALADRLLESACLGVLFQLRTRILPEEAMLLPRPDRCLGGFGRGVRDREIRIDTVAFNLSSLLDLYRLLREERRDGIGRSIP